MHENMYFQQKQEIVHVMLATENMYLESKHDPVFLRKINSDFKPAINRCSDRQEDQKKNK